MLFQILGEEAKNQYLSPSPDKVSLKDVVDFRIYDSHLQEIPLPTSKQNVSIVDKRRVIHFDTFPIELSSGVYFFKVKFEDSEVFGKFSVID